MFFMPAKLLREVEARMLSFISPIAWTKLGLLSVVKDLYGVQCEIADLRRANVAAIRSTHERHADIQQGTSLSLGRWQDEKMIMHPAVS